MFHTQAMDFARLVLATAVGMQVVLWSWHFLERAILSRFASKPNLPRVVFTLLAVSGAALTVVMARGLIHWAREDALTEPVTRRLVVGAFFLCVIAFGFFRSRSASMLDDERLPAYWRTKSLTLAMAVPVFILSVIQVPCLSAQWTVAFAEACGRFVDLPVVGIAIGAMAAVHLLGTSLACTVGLVLLKRL